MEDEFDLTCEAIAGSCPPLEDIIYPEFEDALYADDTTWILTSSFVILTVSSTITLHPRSMPCSLTLTELCSARQMQSGFGLLEIGVSSPGNEVNVMLKNVCDILFGALAFYLFGYGIAYGTPS